MATTPLFHGIAVLTLACLAPLAAQARQPADLEPLVARGIAPLMGQHGAPGMSVAVITPAGTQVFHYGLASKDTGKPVDDRTLFEIGSISKTFTATLAAVAAAQGKLRLSDPVAAHLPALAGSAFGEVPLLHLATHTPGGMPLQFPDGVTDDAQMLRFFRDWKPAAAPGTVRTYANPSIGLLGRIAARSMGQPYANAVASAVFAPLGMDHTYLAVPEDEAAHYAQGYTRGDQAARLSPGVLADEAYGVKTTAADLARFVRAHLGLAPLPPGFKRALADTRHGYFKTGPMVQDLIWEQYPPPFTLDALLAGNSAEMALSPQAVSAIDPPLAPQADAWINKTGSTNGFGGYVAFIPARQLGIVLLANKNIPIPARVEAASQILSALQADQLNGVLGTPELLAHARRFED